MNILQYIGPTIEWIPTDPQVAVIVVVSAIPFFAGVVIFLSSFGDQPGVSMVESVPDQFGAMMLGPALVVVGGIIFLTGTIGLLIFCLMVVIATFYCLRPAKIN